MRRSIILIFSIFIIMMAGCGNNTTLNDVKKYLEKNFNVQTFNNVKTGQPIIGNEKNYYVQFSDSENNDCLAILNKNIRNYIVLYENKVINSDTNLLSQKYEDIIKVLKNPAENEHQSEYKVIIDITSIKIVECKTNTSIFKDGNVGVIRFTTHYEYKDKEKGKIVAPESGNGMLLFNTSTKGQYQFPID